MGKGSRGGVKAKKEPVSESTTTEKGEIEEFRDVLSQSYDYMDYGSGEMSDEDYF